jgi:hypothetical protein
MRAVLVFDGVVLMLVVTQCVSLRFDRQFWYQAKREQFSEE